MGRHWFCDSTTMGPGYAEQRRSSGGKPAEFNTTHWTVVLTARDRSLPEAQAAMETLCRIYWYPLYVYLRRRGYLPHDAQDLTQSFFMHLLRQDFLHAVSGEKGRFRSFLLVCLNHFLADQWDKVRTEKRGGGQRILSLDEQATEARYRQEPIDLADAETLYERRWALTLLDRVLSRLEAEFAAAGKSHLFDQLQGHLQGEKNSQTYAQVAERLATTEAAIKLTVHRMRQRYRELFREEIARIVIDPDDIDGEIRYLFSVLARQVPS